MSELVGAVSGKPVWFWYPSTLSNSTASNPFAAHMSRRARMIGRRTRSLRMSSHRSPGHPLAPFHAYREVTGIGPEVLPRTGADVADDRAPGRVEILDGRA